MPRRRLLPSLAFAAIALSMVSCDLVTDIAGDLLGGETLVPTALAPVVDLSSQKATLVQYPSLNSLGVYSCQRLLGPVACLAFGAPPSRAELEFRFQTVFHIRNPNRYPVPTTELLVALQLWPAETFGDLGAVCTTLCTPGAADCPIPAGEQCVDHPEDVRDLESFLQAALRGLVTLAWQVATGQPVGDLSAWTIPASDVIDLTFTFAIGIDPMLKLIEEAADDVLRQVLQTGGGELTIPYAIGGKLWFQVPYLGRVAVGAGPYGAPPNTPLTWKVL